MPHNNKSKKVKLNKQGASLFSGEIINAKAKAIQNIANFLDDKSVCALASVNKLAHEVINKQETDKDLFVINEKNVPATTPYRNEFINVDGKYYVFHTNGSVEQRKGTYAELRQALKQSQQRSKKLINLCAEEAVWEILNRWAACCFMLGMMGGALGLGFGTAAIVDSIPPIAIIGTVVVGSFSLVGCGAGSLICLFKKARDRKEEINTEKSKLYLSENTLKLK